MMIYETYKEGKKYEISKDSDLLARQTDNHDKGAGIPQGDERATGTGQEGRSPAREAGVLKMTKEEFVNHLKELGLEIPSNVEAVPCCGGEGCPGWTLEMKEKKQE